jgi:hypothetical protein
MSERDSCSSNNLRCDFGGEHKLALVQKITRMIERYNQDEAIEPCPTCLRDTMLDLAALLHHEAEKIYAARNAIDAKSFDETFAEAARERSKKVLEALAVANVQVKRSRTMM